MTVSELCRQMTRADVRVLPHDHRMGPRLVCPEYSKSVQDVKTYPLLEEEQIFALCWNLKAGMELYATMYPAPEEFCYHYQFASEEKTQLHTHDYPYYP